MIFTKLWERYFLKETIKVFLFFLISFYSLYVLIDYSNHAGSFKHYHFSFLDIVKFYAFEFVSKMDLLVPFALLIATVKTLCSLNTHNELVALMASGIKLKRLLVPFIALGLVMTGLIYFNMEVLKPIAFKYNTQLDHSRAKAKQKRNRAIQQVILKDNSTLIFQEYNALDDQLFDVYWLRSIDDIFRIRTLKLTEPPEGLAVEHLQRNDKGFIILTESANSTTFPEMQFDKKQLLESISSPEAKSISDLKLKLPSNNKELSEKEASLLTTYYYKLALPWLCLLAVLAPAPLCIRFSRTLPIFFVYSISIFGLVAFYLIIDAAVVLSERQMVAPIVAIWLPFATFFTFFGIRFLRL